jgi:hypothetical protein
VDDQAYDKAKALKQQLAAAVKSRAKDLRSSRGKPQYRVNRLLILSTDGSLQTTDPSGSFPVTLSEPSNKGKEVFMQPCWSPGADLIVATKVQLAGERLAQSKESTVRVFWALDGSEMVDVTAPYIPFFYFWMPDSKEVVYLTTYGDAKPEAGWQVSMDMVRVMSEESSALLQGGGIMHVDEGVPLFFCPSPRDRRLLLHVGDKKQGTQFTRFTGTKVLILTQRSQDYRAALARGSRSDFVNPPWRVSMPRLAPEEGLQRRRVGGVRPSWSGRQ